MIQHETSQASENAQGAKLRDSLGTRAHGFALQTQRRRYGVSSSPVDNCRTRPRIVIATVSRKYTYIISNASIYCTVCIFCLRNTSSRNSAGWRKNRVWNWIFGLMTAYWIHKCYSPTSTTNVLACRVSMLHNIRRTQLRRGQASLLHDIHNVW